MSVYALDCGVRRRAAPIATGTTAGGSADTGIHHHIPLAVVDCSATVRPSGAGRSPRPLLRPESLGQPYFQGACRPGVPVFGYVPRGRGGLGACPELALPWRLQAKRVTTQLRTTPSPRPEFLSGGLSRRWRGAALARSRCGPNHRHLLSSVW
jgi:hypothetical protein